ncbi:MAG TPA: hypothetical protein VJQ56_12055 [Blastocatellia bacterium]|nr:hypothetical protein [Blastocatellia bacterium]
MRSTRWIELYVQRIIKTIDQLLRKPEGASAALRATGGMSVTDSLVVALPLAALYGIGIGIGADIKTALYDGVKLSLVLVASAAICLPSFYVFSALAGARFAALEAARAVSGFILLTSIIWAALAPVTGFFTASVPSGAFLTVLHAAALLLGFAIGGLTLGRALVRPAPRSFEPGAKQETLESASAGSEVARVSRGFYVVWFAVYSVVVCQLFVDFTPFIETGPFLRPERVLFLDLLKRGF